MHIIGITGPIGHGKTTFAEALAGTEPKSCHFESSSVIMEVANAWHRTLTEPINPNDIDALNVWVEKLPEVLHSVLAIDSSFESLRLDPSDIRKNPVEYQKLLTHAEKIQKDFSLARTRITNENKPVYRPILQWLGGYLVRRLDGTIWHKEIVRRIEAAQSGGMTLCTVGGLRFPGDATVLREVGGVIIKLHRPNYGQDDLLDPTERERDSIQVDATIFNDGTTEDLRACAAKLLSDIKKQQLQREYRSADLSTIR